MMHEYTPVIRKDVTVYEVIGEIRDCHAEMEACMQALFRYAEAAVESKKRYRMQYVMTYAQTNGAVRNRENAAEAATIELCATSELDKSMEKATRDNLDRLGKKLMSLMSILSTFRSEANATGSQSHGF